MAREKITFVATRYKNEKPSISFYAQNGQRVSSDVVKREPAKHKISFTANVK